MDRRIFVVDILDRNVNVVLLLMIVDWASQHQLATRPIFSWKLGLKEKQKGKIILIKN